MHESVQIGVGFGLAAMRRKVLSKFHHQPGGGGEGALVFVEGKEVGGTGEGGGGDVQHVHRFVREVGEKILASQNAGVTHARA